MRTLPSVVIALVLVAAFLLLHLAYSGSLFRAIFYGARMKHDMSIPPPFTCDTNTSAIFDSSNKPCVNISSIIPSQGVSSYRSDQLAYLYCGIPKNGCTYHLAIMLRLMGYPYETNFYVHRPESADLLRPGEEINEMLLEDIRRYAIVRNPMHRVLSGYLDKVERFYTDDSLKTPRTFRKWVYKTLKPRMKWNRVNWHWKAQVQFCGFKSRNLWSYFTLFRVERPEQYVKYMEEFLPDSVLRDGWDMPRNKSFTESVLGPRKRTGNTTERFYDYTGNVKMFDYLRQVYSEDISMLGYEEEVDEMRKKLVER